MNEEQSMRTIREFFDAWNAKDWERWGQLHAENAHHSGPDHAQPLSGRQAILGAHTGLGKVFPDFRYEITRMFAQDDLVCAEWTLAGTQTGPLPGPGGRIEPTGKKININGAFVFRVQDGKVSEYVGHVDFLAMYRQLGAIPPLSSDVGRQEPAMAPSQPTPGMGAAPNMAPAKA
jgi:steroid delta-isomerase-like uncharacterized protein